MATKACFNGPFVELLVHSLFQNSWFISKWSMWLVFHESLIQLLKWFIQKLIHSKTNHQTVPFWQKSSTLVLFRTHSISGTKKKDDIVVRSVKTINGNDIQWNITLPCVLLSNHYRFLKYNKHIWNKGYIITFLFSFF